MQPATMTKSAKTELKEKYVLGLARFLSIDIPKDEAVVQWVAQYKKEHMEALNKDERWLALPEEHRQRIIAKMDQESFDLLGLMADVSEQKIWQLTQQLALQSPTIVRLLQDPKSKLTAPQKLKFTVDTLQTRVVAYLHMMRALQQMPSQAEQEAGMAMAMMAEALKKIAEFPYDKLRPENADKLCRYLKAIVSLVCPISIHEQ